MTDGLQDLRNTTFTTPYSLVFGNEGAGLDQQFLHVGTSVKIAYENKIDSLNLSTAVGIALYEAYVRN
jgi:TrmH family RNA methyltransferase